MKMRKSIGRRARPGSSHTYADNPRRSQKLHGDDDTPLCFTCMDDETRCSCGIPLSRPCGIQHGHGDVCGICGYGMADGTEPIQDHPIQICAHGVWLIDGGCHFCALESAQMRGNGTDYDD